MTAVDIRVFGNVALEKKLGRILAKTQKSIVRKALRKEAVQVQDRIIQNIKTQGLIDEGNLIEGFESAKIRSGGDRNFIRIGPEWPKRTELGIAPGDKYYYPMAVEMGHGNVPAYPYVRPAVDNHKEPAKARIAADIAEGIIRAAK